MSGTHATEPRYAASKENQNVRPSGAAPGATPDDRASKTSSIRVIEPGVAPGATPDARAQNYFFGPLHRPNPGGAEKTGFQPVTLIHVISYNLSEAPEDRLGSERR